MTDLARRVLKLSGPLEPEPTAAVPRLPTLAGVRAVLFDVYGTLLASRSGDISLTSGAERGGAARDAFRACGVDDYLDGEQIVQTLKQEIERRHAASVSEHPEVEIRDVWRSVLATLQPARDWSSVDVELLAVEYECRVNPIWPMPGLDETLGALRASGMPMGIVSNAQFFTPIALEALGGAPLGGLGFDRELCLWSYAHLEAKPGRCLYERAAALLAARGVRPAEALYVGNDMRNDMAPAAAVGFRTALFAGDARSLRLREGDPLVGDLRPDAVITELRQLLSILSLAAG